MEQERLIQAFRGLDIPELQSLESLGQLPGRAVNLEYALPSGQTARFLSEDKMYWCSQVHKENSHRCYGLVSDGTFLFVCEYGDYGSDAQVILFKRM